jgi:hypothetical protein
MRQRRHIFGWFEKITAGGGNRTPVPAWAPFHFFIRRWQHHYEPRNVSW